MPSGRCHFSQNGVVQVPLRSSLQGHRDILPLGLLPLGLRVLDEFLSFCCMKELGEGFGCVDFARFIDIVSETAIVSFRTLPVTFPFPTFLIDFHCSRCFILGFLTTALDSKFPFLASKFFIRKFWSILLFTIVFNL